MKRKIIAMLMCLVMFCCAAYAEDAAGEAPDLTGVWELDAIESDGITGDPTVVGLEMILTVNADGTIVLSSTVTEEVVGT